MKIFHTYKDTHFEGLIKNNFINKNSGLYIKHNCLMPAEAKFNVVAAKGSELYNIVKENKFPFYVDRVAGGLYYHKYPWDFELMDEYVNLLGNDFLGFQFHEIGSNLRVDWMEIRAKLGGNGPFTAEELIEKCKPEGKLSILNVGNKRTGEPADFAGKTGPTSPKELMEQLREIYERFLKVTNGHLLPCDSYVVPIRMQNELGIKNLMPEVGWQTALMRVQLAYTRGLSECYNQTWGVYYEPWRYIPDMDDTSAPGFNDTMNEWHQPRWYHDFITYGANGGSSRLMQRRIYYYSLLSGAQYISEEYGLNNCFSDTVEFTLSPYGEVKKELIEENEKIGKVRPVTPFAIVLPLSYESLELPGQEPFVAVGESDGKYLGFALEYEKSIYYSKIRDVIKFVYARNGAVYGNEGHVMTNSRFGDMFDIIYADAPSEILDKYEYLIDADPDCGFNSSQSAKGRKVLLSTDLDCLETRINEVVPDVMPCYVDKLHWMVSVGENGKRYLAIFNNEGNDRTILRGDYVNPEADRVVNITFNENVTPKLYKSTADETVIEKTADNKYCVNVPATGFVILNF